MAKYDSQGVPILGFHNPAGTILYPKGLNSYSMGNTRAKDITELLGTSKEQHLDLLLLASGDVRNIFYTVSEISLRKLQERPESLSFHLNDYDPSIVARNAILLEVAGSINPDVSGDMDFLWNIWYNMTHSEAHFVRLQQIISTLIGKNFDGSDQSVLMFKDGAVLQECRDIWKDWMQLDLNVKSVKDDRKKFIEGKMQELDFNVDGQFFSVLSQMMMGINADTAVLDVLLPQPTNPFYTEIKHWFIEGSTSDDSDKVNPTLIRPFVHKWRQHYSACAFEGYLPFERQDLLRCKTLTAACKESLKLLVKRYQQYKKSHSAALKVTLWTGDALSLCTSGFPPGLAFDVIDTSNVGDHIGLLNVLICCASRLKKPNESLLLTSSMLWCGGCQSIEEFYNKCVGVPVQLLPTVLGLKLAVDLELGSSKLPDRLETNEEILCWVKAEPKRTLLTIEKNSDVAKALLRLVERCFNLLKEQESQMYGVTLSSPLTFLRIIHHIQPLFEGGATALFDVLESELPSDFNKKFGLSWNLLKASIGSEREPVVEVKATTKVSTASWYNGTPMPMVCIMDHKSFGLGQFQFSGLPLPVDPTFPVIYNSMRYDDTTHVVTFHLREKDWDELKSNAWMWIASRDMKPIIEGEPIFLGGEAVVTARRVDPVEKFGLSYVHTFTEVESDNNCEILKVVKVEENKFSYCAELEILDAVRCKAKAMKIRFQPDTCPTEVIIFFIGAEREQCIMYFSCAVDENSSKFQISRTRGKVLCHIPKREDGTVGELVIQSPAPVPFHAMATWDVKVERLDSIAKVCGKMFRTKVDLDLKSQGKSGSPFFNLRETIAMILVGHINEPKMNKIYCIDELGVIEEPYQTPDTMARKKGFVIKVLQMYKWKNLPILKVLFYDSQRFANQLRSDATAAARVMSSFFSVTWLHIVQRIVADQQEKCLLRKLLYTNAARVAQDNGSYAWKDSYLSPLFPRESNLQFFETMKGLMTDFPFNQFFPSPNNTPTEQDISPDGLSEFLSGLLESGMGSFFTSLDHTSTCSPPQWAPPLREPECASCHSKTGDLKRCLGCKKVFYCGKKCQTQHWKKHKPECTINS